MLNEITPTAEASHVESRVIVSKIGNNNTHLLIYYNLNWLDRRNVETSALFKNINPDTSENGNYDFVSVSASS